MIYSRYGCELKDLHKKVSPNGEVSNEIIIATRIDDGAIKEYHISQLTATNGIQEIMEVLK